jgi:hypothetical protein
MLCLIRDGNTGFTTSMHSVGDLGSPGPPPGALLVPAKRDLKNLWSGARRLAAILGPDGCTRRSADVWRALASRSQRAAHRGQSSSLFGLSMRMAKFRRGKESQFGCHRPVNVGCDEHDSTFNYRTATLLPLAASRTHSDPRLTASTAV